MSALNCDSLNKQLKKKTKNGGVSQFANEFPQTSIRQQRMGPRDQREGAGRSRKREGGVRRGGAHMHSLS